MTPSTLLPLIPLARFAARVMSRFVANKGFLLASAVSYNALLSLIPLLALMLVALSHVLDEQHLRSVLMSEFEFFLPGQAQALSSEIDLFLANRDVFGWVGIVVLLFFSSLAFGSLENAIAVICQRTRRRRGLWVSVVMSYAFVLVLGVAICMETLLVTVLIQLSDSQMTMLGHYVPLDDLSSVMGNLLSFVGLVALLTGIYLFMPVIDVRFRWALAGGFTAACLWMLIRYFLLWYFRSVSFVNVVYGSFATVVVILLTLEAAAVIVLLGAQVIAEAGRPSRRRLS